MVMRDNGLTHRETAYRLSDILGRRVEWSVVSRHIDGTSKPRVEYLCAYADLFGLPLDFFTELVPLNESTWLDRG